MCEEILLQKREPGFNTLILRPATVCGLSPRLRLDVSVNMLAYQGCAAAKRVFDVIDKPISIKQDNIE